MTGTELLLDVPKMQRDLQRAREENARFREFLKRLNVSAADVAAVASDSARQQPSGDEDEGGEDATQGAAAATKAAASARRVPQREDDDDDDDYDDYVAVLGASQSRRHGRASSPGESKALELKNAEERVAQLEAQLLDAEETICHLKAERMAALRDAERFRLALADAERRSVYSDDGGDDDKKATEMRRLVLELESKLSDVQKDCATEQEQHMAVIREQEGEIRALARELEDKDQELATLRDKYLDAVEEIQLAADMDAVDAVVKSDLKVNGEEEEEEEMRGRPSTHDMDWREELVRHPTPHFDLDSPEVQYLLHTWTGNVKKLHYLRLWFTRVVTTRGALPDDFPLGIELPRLTPEVRDGFLTLVVPLLRRQTEREILVHSRRYNDPLHSDLRIRVVPRR